jgi:hypothetical protein
MAKQAVVVSYKVMPGKMGEFLPILRRHVADTKVRESACLQFDILVPHEGGASCNASETAPLLAQRSIA